MERLCCGACASKMQSHQQANRVSIDAALRLQSLAPIRNVALSEHKLKSGQYQHRLFALMAEVAASLSYSIPIIIPIMRTGSPTLKYCCRRWRHSKTAADPHAVAFQLVFVVSNAASLVVVIVVVRVIKNLLASNLPKVAT